MNIHVFVLPLLFAAGKFVEDRVYSNSNLAFTGGVHIQELNLEYLFNEAADWGLFVPADECKA